MKKLIIGLLLFVSFFKIEAQNFLPVPYAKIKQVWNTTSVPRGINQDSTWLSIVTYAAKQAQLYNWALVGNSNLDRSVNWFGTNDTAALLMKQNGKLSGLIDVNGNVYFGVQSINGGLALVNTSLRNAYFGANAGPFTIGSYNTGTGEATLYHNTSGNYNTADGGTALFNNTTGNLNVAVGWGSGSVNTTGNNNTYIGAGATSSANNYSYATAIGGGASVDSSYHTTIGNVSNKVINYYGALRPQGSIGAPGQVLTSNGSNGEIWSTPSVVIGDSGVVAGYGEKVTHAKPRVVTLDTTIAASQSRLTKALVPYQKAITLTTTGSSGSSTFLSNTLNVPQYVSDSGVVAGYAMNVTHAKPRVATPDTTILASQSRLTKSLVPYQKSISLTTTGTSGSASFSSNTLNIPTYQSAYTNLTSIGGLSNASGYLYNNGSGTFSYTTPVQDSGAANSWALKITAAKPRLFKVDTTTGNANGARLATQYWVKNNSSGWGLTGNSGLTAGTNFIGTTDAIDLVFKVNNNESGRIDQINYNTSFGYGINWTSITGVSNSAFGKAAGRSITSGAYNSLFGQDAGQGNLTNSQISAFGFQSLYNSIADNNSGFGYKTLYTTTTGNQNSAFGSYSLVFNITGSNNSAFGYNSLKNQTGSYNTSLGANTGSSTYPSINNSIMLGYNTYVTGSNMGNISDGSGTLKMGINQSSPNAALDVKGIGSSSGTNTMLVENSSATNEFLIQDNGQIGINGTTATNVLTTIHGTGNTSSTIDLMTINSSNTINTAILDNGDIQTAGNLQVGSNNWTYNSGNVTLSIYNNTTSFGRVSLGSSAGLFGFGSAYGTYGSTNVNNAVALDNAGGNLYLSSRGYKVILGNVAGAINILTINTGTGANAGFNTATPDVSAIVDMESTTQGFLPPQMTTTQKTAISSPKAGLVVYDTTLNKLSYYNGSTWINL